MARRLKYPIHWTADAEQDLVEARTWYAKTAPHVAARLRATIRSAVQKIGDNPRLYPRVHASVRRAVILQFPYSIYYQIEDERVVVIAVVRQARSPRVWRERLP